MENTVLFDKIRYLMKKKHSFVEICESLELKDYEVIGLIELMKSNGELVDYLNGEIIRLKQPQIVEDVYHVNALNTQRILAVSDTHLASKYDRLDILRYVYNKAKEMGIDTVVHIGDMTDGDYTKIRPQQAYELRALGADAQTEYVVNEYPYVDGIKTYFIGGNHDFTHIKNGGYDIGRAISRQRDDLIYLGQDVADLQMGKLKMRLYHGSKGNSYAKSYKLQKYAEIIPQSEKPQILFRGHSHDAFYMKYQDMDCFQVPSILDPTPYSKQEGMQNFKGVWWIDIDYDIKGNIIRITPTLETFGPKLVKKR